MAAGGTPFGHVCMVSHSFCWNSGAVCVQLVNSEEDERARGIFKRETGQAKVGPWSMEASHLSCGMQFVSDGSGIADLCLLGQGSSGKVFL